MKNSILFFTLICSLLLSCKKDKHANSGKTATRYPVTFSVNGFSQTTGPITNAIGKQTNNVVPAGSSLNNIVYVLFKADGTAIKNIYQYKGTGYGQVFGTIKDTLEKGNYVAVFYGTPLTDQLTLGAATEVSVHNGQELFSKRVNFTVGETNNSQTVNLERISASCKIVLEDISAAPPFSTIVVTFTDDSQFAVFPDTAIQQKAISWSLLNKGKYDPNSSYSVYDGIYHTSGPVTMQITVSGLTTVIAKKTINNVMFYKNTQTILSGKLFAADTAGTNGLTPTFNTTFKADTTIKF